MVKELVINFQHVIVMLNGLVLIVHIEFVLRERHGAIWRLRRILLIN